MNSITHRKNQMIRSAINAFVLYADPMMTEDAIHEELTGDYPDYDPEMLDRIEKAVVATLKALGEVIY